MNQNTARGIALPLAMALALGVVPARAQSLGGGTSLITIAQNIATMITGPFGVSAIIIAVSGTALAAAMHFLPGRHIFTAIGCGAVAFTAAWLVNSYLI